MKSFLIFIFIIAFINCENKYNEAMTNLDRLEQFANEYFKAKTDISVNQLILRYIRTGRYTGTEWTLAAGETPEEFIKFVEQKDAELGTTTSALRSYKDNEILLPDTPEGTPTDFVHMFAVMNGIDYQETYEGDLTVLQSWGGDTAQLFQDIFNLTDKTLDELIKEARTRLGVSGGFGKADLISDLDAVSYINLRQTNPNKSYVNILKDYLVDLNITKRVNGFLIKSFPALYQNNASTKEDYRNTVFTKYDGNSFIKIWECQQGLREAGIVGCYTPGQVKEGKENNRKAATYAFADYLFETKSPYVPPQPVPSNSKYVQYYYLIALVSLILLV